jgi:phage-related protein
VTVLGEGVVVVRSDTSRFKSETEAGVRSGILSAAKSAAALLGVTLGAEKLFEFGKGAIESAAQVQKAGEEIKGSYGAQAQAVTNFANNATSQYSISKTASEEFAAQIGFQGKQMGLTTKQTADMALELQRYSGDVGKLKGQDPSQYFGLLEKSMLGNTRGLKTLGITTTSTTLAQELFNHHVQLAAVDQTKVQAAHLKVTAAMQTLTQAQDKYGKNSLQARTAQNALTQAQQGVQKAMLGTTASMTPAQKALAIYYTLLDHQKQIAEEAAKHQHDYANEILYLKAVFANVQLAIGQFLVAGLTPLVRAFATYLPKAIQFFSKEWAKLRGFIVSSGILKGFQEIAAILAGSLIGTIEATWKAVEHLAGALAPLTTQLAPLAKLFAELVAVLAVGVFVAAAAAIQGIADAITAIPAPILRAVAVGVGAVVAAFTAWLGIQAAVYGSMLLLNNGLDLVAAGFAALDASAIIWIAVIAAVAIAAYEIYTHWDAVRALLDTVWKAITSAFTATWDFIKGVVSSFLNWLGAHWQLILAILVGPIGIAVYEIKAHWNTIVNDAQAAWQAVKGAIQAVINWLGGVPGTVAGIAVSIGSAIIRGIVNGISNLIGSVRTALGRIGGIISGLYNTVQREAESIGSAIIRGIVNGVENLIGWAANQVGNAVHDVVNFAKSLVGSTAEEYSAKTIGKPIMEGIATGVQAGIPGLAQTLGSAVGEAIKGAVPQGHLQVPAAGAAATLGSGVTIHGMTVVANNPEQFMSQLNDIARRVA